MALPSNASHAGCSLEREMHTDPAPTRDQTRSVLMRGRSPAGGPLGIGERLASTERSLRRAILLATVWAGGLTAVALLGLQRAVATQHVGLAHPIRLLPALLLASTSYLLRFGRWHLLATGVVQRLGWRTSGLTWAIGFAFFVTPGRLGEILKLDIVRRRTGTPVARLVPVVAAERAIDVAAFLLLMLSLSPLALPIPAMLGWGGWLLAGAAAVIGAGALVSGVRCGVFNSLRSHHLFRRLAIRDFVTGIRGLAFGRLIGGLAMTLVARLADGLACAAVVAALGVAVPPVAVIFSLAMAGTAGGLSLLPGGVGAVEGSLIAALSAFGVAVETAAVAALVVRVLMVWCWVGLGTVAALAYYGVHVYRERIL